MQSVYFQTRSWQNTYSRFPELLLIDATYKLNNLKMPLYVLMVVDGNGESEIIALWLVSAEDECTIGYLMDVFMKWNDAKKTRCVMVDKDMTERNIITEKLPNANL